MSPVPLTPPMDAGLTFCWSKNIFRGIGDQSSLALEARPGTQQVLTRKGPWTVRASGHKALVSNLQSPRYTPKLTQFSRNKKECLGKIVSTGPG